MRRSAISCHQMSILPLQTKNDLTDLARYCKQRWPSQLVGKDRIFLLSPIQLSIEWFCKQIHIQSYIYIYTLVLSKKQTTMLIHDNFTMFSSNFSQSTPQASYPIFCACQHLDAPNAPHHPQQSKEPQRRRLDVQWSWLGPCHSHAIPIPLTWWNWWFHMVLPSNFRVSTANMFDNQKT